MWNPPQIAGKVAENGAELLPFAQQFAGLITIS
jgi:hypothetical protein